MRKDDFIKLYCKKSNITKDTLLKTQVVLPCKCNINVCKGWAVVSNNKLSIKAHNDLYT